MFGRQDSLFAARYECLQLAKLSYDDLITHGEKMNCDYERFKVYDFSSGQFKNLIFQYGLKSVEDAGIRLKLPSKTGI